MPRNRSEKCPVSGARKQCQAYVDAYEAYVSEENSFGGSEVLRTWAAIPLVAQDRILALQKRYIVHRVRCASIKRILKGHAKKSK